MNDKTKEIKDYFEKHGVVYLGKQCKQEYILYSYYASILKRDSINSMRKVHFKNKDSKTLIIAKNKEKRVEISIDDFFCNTIYDLINRGYELVTHGIPPQKG